MIALAHGAKTGHEMQLDSAGWRRIRSDFAQSLPRGLRCAAKVT
jgi:hypothetical protein